MLVHQNHAAGEENGSIMVGMFMSLCLARQKPSKREFFVPAGMDLGVKLLNPINHSSWQLLFFIVWQPYFLGVVRNHVSLGSPNHNLHMRISREICRMTSGTLRRRGRMLAIPDTKILCRINLCRHDRGILAKFADIRLSWRHVANMSSTFSATLWQTRTVLSRLLV